MLDPVEKHFDVVPADENYGAEKGQGRDRDRDIAYRVWVDAADSRVLGGTHSILNIVYIDDLIHVRSTFLISSAIS